MYNKDLMKQAIKESGMTIRAISAKTGIKYETLRRKLHGRNPWFLDEVGEISRVLRLTGKERNEIFFGPELTDQ